MFKRLEETPQSTVSVTIDGRAFTVPAGETVAAAVLASGIRHTRTTPISGAARAPLCLMGVCYECLMIIDGQPNRRACQQRVHEGMSIELQQGVGELPS